jgi:hypothetical protein
MVSRGHLTPPTPIYLSRVARVRKETAEHPVTSELQINNKSVLSIVCLIFVFYIPWVPFLRDLPFQVLVQIETLKDDNLLSKMSEKLAVHLDC